MKLTLYRGVRDYHQTKTYGTGLWFSTSKNVARSYSNNIITKTIDSDNVKIIDCKGLPWKKINTDELARKYKDFDVIVFNSKEEYKQKYFNYKEPEISKKNLKDDVLASKQDDGSYSLNIPGFEVTENRNLSIK